MNEPLVISKQAEMAAEEFRASVGWSKSAKSVANLERIIQVAINESTAPLKAEIEQLRSIAIGVNMDELHRLQQHVKVLREAVSEVDECVCCDGKISNQLWTKCKKALELTNPNS